MMNVDRFHGIRVCCFYNQRFPPASLPEKPIGNRKGQNHHRFSGNPLRFSGFLFYRRDGSRLIAGNQAAPAFIPGTAVAAPAG